MCVSRRATRPVYTYYINTCTCVCVVDNLLNCIPPLYACLDKVHMCTYSTYTRVHVCVDERHCSFTSIAYRQCSCTHITYIRLHVHILHTYAYMWVYHKATRSVYVLCTRYEYVCLCRRAVSFTRYTHSAFSTYTYAYLRSHARFVMCMYNRGLTLSSCTRRVYGGGGMTDY